MGEKKNRLEEYIKALVEAEEARMTTNIILGLAVTMVYIFTWTIFIVISDNPVFVGMFGMAVTAIALGIAAGRMRAKQHEAEQKRDLLHPTEGEEGLITVIKNQINENITGILGKKFTGFRTKDDLNG